MRILVSTASRHGATIEIGNAIAIVLRQLGHEVDVRDPQVVRSAARYDAVVVGSAIYTGRWLPAARELIERTEASLRKRLVWLFSSGPIGDPAKPTDAPPDGAVLRERIQAREHRVFAGKLERSSLGFSERAMVTFVGATPGDYRPWDDVIDWARHIGAELAAVGPESGGYTRSNAAATEPPPPRHRVARP
jgi:menaquinone-dependent protoporphyrinogen oxidase